MISAVMFEIFPLNLHHSLFPFLVRESRHEKSLQGKRRRPPCRFASLILSNYARTRYVPDLLDVFQGRSKFSPAKRYGKSGSIGQSPFDEPVRLRSLTTDRSGQYFVSSTLLKCFIIHQTQKIQSNSSYMLKKTPRVSRNACFRAPDAV